MAYKKPLVTTEVTVHGMQTNITFADAITNGVTTRDGSLARQQILRGETISANDSNGDATVIPYHAIIMALVTVAESEAQEEPDDDFCVTGDGK